MDMNDFKCLMEFVANELRVVEFNPDEHVYQTKYESVFRKLKKVGEKDGWKVHLVSKDKDYTKFYLREDFEKQCCDILDELNLRNVKQDEIDKICSVFPEGYTTFSNGPFHTTPKLINDIEDLVYWLEERAEEPIKAALILASNRRGINLDNNEYWFYIEGTNWEPIIHYQPYMLEYIKSAVTFSDIEVQEKLLKVLKEIKGCD